MLLLPVTGTVHDGLFLLMSLKENVDITHKKKDARG